MVGARNGCVWVSWWRSTRQLRLEGASVPSSESVAVACSAIVSPTANRAAAVGVSIVTSGARLPGSIRSDAGVETPAAVVPHCQRCCERARSRVGVGRRRACRGQWRRSVTEIPDVRQRVARIQDQSSCSRRSRPQAAAHPTWRGGHARGRRPVRRRLSARSGAPRRRSSRSCSRAPAHAADGPNVMSTTRCRRPSRTRSGEAAAAVGDELEDLAAVVVAEEVGAVVGRRPHAVRARRRRR